MAREKDHTFIPLPVEPCAMKSESPLTPLVRPRHHTPRMPLQVMLLGRPTQRLGVHIKWDLPASKDYRLFEDRWPGRCFLGSGEGQQGSESIPRSLRFSTRSRLLLDRYRRRFARRSEHRGSRRGGFRCLRQAVPPVSQSASEVPLPLLSRKLHPKR